MDRARVEEAIRLGGLDPLPDDIEIEIEGDDPALPSPHRLGEGASVARLLTGVAANALWQARGHAPQRLGVDMRHAAAALRSYTQLTFEDETKQPEVMPRGWPMITRIMAARDGRYLQIHGSFGDTPKILEILGLDTTASIEDVETAVAGWDAFELEQAFIDAKVCGGVVRSRDEWAEHPQGQVLAEWPVVKITKIGEAPPQPLPDAPAGTEERPASGIRVVDMTRVLAGPTCAKTLAEHGADVLHVTAAHLPSSALFDVETGIGKRQIAIDLNDADQAGTLRGLIREADVFSQGFRLGTLARRGLSPEQLAELRPGIVYVAENCYGHEGPWAERPGWEQLGQAATGMSYREGEAKEDGVPVLAPAAVNDYSTGYLAAYGAMTALARRATEGGSWLVQVSLSRTCMWYQDLGDDLDPADYEPADVEPFRAQMESPDYGRLTYLTPALSMSETQPRWELPPVEHGSHEPAWLPR